MKKDLNMGITSMAYNYLNLPQTIVKSGSTLSYVYDANGTKLSYTANGKTTDYIGSFVSENGLLSYIITAEGRIVVDNYDYSYEYNLKDHLGNTRVVMDESGDILQVSDYYPFGMEMPGRIYRSDKSYRFGYQGQFAEKDEETGYSQFELRLFDNRIGRWLCPDPAGQYWSPYLGMGNNPVNGVDPDGAWFGNGDGDPPKKLSVVYNAPYNVSTMNDNGDIIMFTTDLEQFYELTAGTFTKSEVTVSPIALDYRYLVQYTNPVKSMLDYLKNYNPINPGGIIFQDRSSSGSNLDFGFRFYDPALARFSCVDPIADDFSHVSPFNYAENRPIDGIDLWGLQYKSGTSVDDLVNGKHAADAIPFRFYDPKIDIYNNNLSLPEDIRFIDPYHNQQFLTSADNEDLTTQNGGSNNLTWSNYASYASFGAQVGKDIILDGLGTQFRWFPNTLEYKAFDLDMGWYDFKYNKSYYSANQELLLYNKTNSFKTNAVSGLRLASDASNIFTTGVAVYNLTQPTRTVTDAADATFGAVGIANSIGQYTGAYSIPYVNLIMGAYTAWTIGGYLGKNYGPIGYFRVRRHWDDWDWYYHRGRPVPIRVKPDYYNNE